MHNGADWTVSSREPVHARERSMNPHMAGDHCVREEAFHVSASEKL